MAPETQGRLSVLAAAFLFSTGGAAIKAITLTSWQVASLRCLVAGAALLILVPESRRHWSWRMVPVAIFYAITLVLFAVSNKLTTSANAIFLQATAPLYLLLIGPWFLKEAVRTRDLVLAALIGVGMACFFWSGDGGSATAPDPRAGNFLAGITGLTWACTLAGFRWLNRAGEKETGLATAVLGNLLGCVAALPMAWSGAAAFPPSFTDVTLLLYLGVFQIGAAYAFLSRGMRHVPAFEASALILLEPALNPLWSFLVHGERPGGLALAGGAIIIGATLWQTWSARNTV